MENTLETHGNLLTTREAARILGVSSATLVNWRRRGAGPRFVRLLRLVRYRREDLDDFIAEKTIVATIHPGCGGELRDGTCQTCGGSVA